MGVTLLLLTATACSPADDDGTDPVDAGSDAAAPSDVTGGGDDMGPEGDTLFLARIIDRTDAEDCGMSTEMLDPGADIFAVGLETESGEPLAWGTLAHASVLADQNDFADPNVIDGVAPQFETNQACPDPIGADNTVALGCNGWIAVEFLDDAGDAIGLTVASGNRIRVYEAGGQCASDSSNDNYALTLCRDRTAVVEQGDPGSCDVMLLQNARGEAFAPLQGF